MKFLRGLNNHGEEYLLVFLMAVAVALVTAQIATRIAGIPLPWSEELARYIFLWLVWVGAAYATKEKKHIVIDIVCNKFPDKVKKVTSILITIIWFLFLVFMIYESMTMTISVFHGGAKATGSGIPMWIPYASVPVGMILMMFRMLQNLVLDWRHGTVGEIGGAD
jgi:TRAP-type C4-dicarboxylate transport system permease small subunit